MSDVGLDQQPPVSPKAAKRQAVKEAKAALANVVGLRDAAKLQDAIAHARAVGVKAEIVIEAEEVLATLPPPAQAPGTGGKDASKNRQAWEEQAKGEKLGVEIDSASCRVLEVHDGRGQKVIVRQGERKSFGVKLDQAGYFYWDCLGITERTRPHADTNHIVCVRQEAADGRRITWTCYKVPVNDADASKLVKSELTQHANPGSAVVELASTACDSAKHSRASGCSSPKASQEAEVVEHSDPFARPQVRRRSQQEQQVLEIFRKFDVDGDGVLDASEFSALLKRLDPTKWTDEAIQRFMAAADLNQDGVIDIKEFIGHVFYNDSGRSWRVSQRRRPPQRLETESDQDVGHCASTPSNAWEAKKDVQAAGAVTYYMYKDERYTSFDDFVIAVERNGSQQQPVMYRPGDKRFREQVKDFFYRYVGDGKRINKSEYRGLAASVAAALGFDPRRFNDLTCTFDRFDINGDGLLDEEESMMLAESILRHYNGQTTTRSSHEVRMMNLGFKNLEEHYELSDKLGQGGQGVVFLAREKATGHQRVLKFFDKNNANAPPEEIKEEFMLLKSLDHPKIQRVYDIFEDRSNIYLVTEPFYGGHLGDLVENAMDASVNPTCGYLAKAMYQVLQGVAYLHSKYVLHCDLKEANMMVTNDKGDMREPSVVVIDFGLARNFVVQGSSGGTLGYMPPEVLTDGLWTPKGDVFSLGVVLYQLFAQNRCFGGWGDEAIRTNTLEATPNYDAILNHWRRCEDLVVLLRTMLNKDVHSRPTVKACMQHAFFLKKVKSHDVEYDELLSPTVVDAVGGLKETNKMKRAILTDIATRLNLAEVKELNQAFGAMDADGDGVITAEEASAALTGLIEPHDLEQAVQRLVGPEGRVAYTAFMGQMLAAKAADENRILWREFRELDRHGTGYLDKGDVEQLLESPALAEMIGARDAAEVMAIMDFDGDGDITFEEFRRALGCSSSRRPSKISVGCNSRMPSKA